MAAQVRICDHETLEIAEGVSGHVRVILESMLGRGLVRAQRTGSNPSVSSGNLVRAIPYGVRHGVDFEYTGEVHGVNAAKIHSPPPYLTTLCRTLDDSSET